MILITQIFILVKFKINIKNRNRKVLKTYYYININN